MSDMHNLNVLFALNVLWQWKVQMKTLIVLLKCVNKTNSDKFPASFDYGIFVYHFYSDLDNNFQE